MVEEVAERKYENLCLRDCPGIHFKKEMKTEVFLNAKRRPIIQLLLLMKIEKHIDKKVEMTSSPRW